jgi:hypothetical protein
VDVVAIMGLARSVEDEAPLLAADLGLTAYEATVMLRAPMPVIVLRSKERARTLELLGKLRARSHDAVACDLDAVASTADMFCPKSFRFEVGDFIGVAKGEERRLPLTEVFALVRATHTTRVEDTVTNHETKLSIGRAAMSGGLMMTKTKTTESKRVADEREAVLYVFRSDAQPWLLQSMQLRYDGLGHEMRRSKIENFDVLQKTLRELAPSAPFDSRLLAVRASAGMVVMAGTKQITASSATAIDLLAHIVAMALGRDTRPYR